MKVFPKLLGVLLVLTFFLAPVSTLAAAEQAPHYWLDLFSELNERKLFGSATLEFTNNTSVTLDRLAFCLYPNVSEPGQPARKYLRLLGASANETELKIENSKDLSSASILLKAPVKPGAQVTVNYGFVLDVPQAPALPGDMWMLKAFFPMLARLDAGKWRADLCSAAEGPRGGYARFDMTLTVPRDWTVMANMEETGTTPNQANWSLWDFIPAPAQGDPIQHVFHPRSVYASDLTLLAGPRLKVRSVEMSGVQVSIVARGKDRTLTRDAEKALQRAIDRYVEQYGRFPLETLRMAIFPGDQNAFDAVPGLMVITYKKGEISLVDLIYQAMVSQ